MNIGGDSLPSISRSYAHSTLGSNVAGLMLLRGPFLAPEVNGHHQANSSNVSTNHHTLTRNSLTNGTGDLQSFAVPGRAGRIARSTHHESSPLDAVTTTSTTSVSTVKDRIRNSMGGNSHSVTVRVNNACVVSVPDLVSCTSQSRKSSGCSSSEEKPPLTNQAPICTSVCIPVKGEMSSNCPDMIVDSNAAKRKGSRLIQSPPNVAVPSESYSNDLKIDRSDDLQPEVNRSTSATLKTTIFI
jgi:hypothetical protein